MQLRLIVSLLMRWRAPLDNKQWSICRPPAVINGCVDDQPFEDVDLGSGIIMYALNNGTHHLPEQIKKYLNNGDDCYLQNDHHAESIRKNGRAYILYVPPHLHYNEKILLSASVMGHAAINLYVVVGAGSTVALIYDQSSYAAITLHLEPYAQVHWSHQNEHIVDDGYTFIISYQQQESRLIFNGWYTRTTYTNMFFILREPKAHTEITLGLHAKKDQHAWFKTTQIHEAPETKSVLVLKGLLATESRSVHLGMIRIEKDARHSDAQLTSRYMLLHNNAQAYAVPSLEVLTNEVTCSHGSSIGTFDDEQLFYLMSRAIGIEECYKLLTDGFFR